MKNFKKVLAVMTAVASMCMSASAFAAVEGSFVTPDTNGVSGTFDYANSTFTITSPASTGEVTILVLEPTADDTNVQSGDIRYINQATGGNFGTMGLKLNPATETEEAETALPVGEYPVKVGYYKADGSFAIATATLKVAEVSTGKTYNIVWGDVTNNGAVDTADITALVNYTVSNGKSYELLDTNGVSKTVAINDTVGSIRWGDVTNNGAVDTADITALVNYTVSNGKKYTVNGVEVSINDSVSIIESNAQ